MDYRPIPGRRAGTLPQDKCGWSTDVERLVKAMVLPGRRQNFGVDEVTALARAELLGVLYDWV
jgi:hypothetical protein